MSRGRIIAVSLAFGIALVLVATQYWGNRSAEVTQLEAQRADTETQLFLEQRALNRTEEFLEGGDASVAELELARAAFPEESDLGGFVTVNATVAGEAGVEVLAVVPEPIEDEVFVESTEDEESVEGAEGEESVEDVANEDSVDGTDDEVSGGNTEDHVRTPMAVTVRGADDAVAAYIRALGELPRLTVIEDVQLTAEGGGLTSASLGVVVFSQ